MLITMSDIFGIDAISPLQGSGISRQLAMDFIHRYVFRAFSANR